jgi:hypothetical protein
MISMTDTISKKICDNFNELYILPQGMPSQIPSHSFYEFNQIEKNIYEIVQNEGNVMMGGVQIIAGEL